MPDGDRERTYPSGAGPRISARQHLTTLIGTTLHTLTHHKPNTVLRVDAETAFVATKKSPTGEPVPLHEVQSALDRLTAGEEVEVTVPSLGHRSSFIGAALAAVPGAVVLPTRPRRVKLTSEPYAQR